MYEPPLTHTCAHMQFMLGLYSLTKHTRSHLSAICCSKSLTFSLLSSSFLISFCSLSLPDPEQSVHVLVCNLRSQCDAVQVTKTAISHCYLPCHQKQRCAHSQLWQRLLVGAQSPHQQSVLQVVS